MIDGNLPRISIEPTEHGWWSWRVYTKYQTYGYAVLRLEAAIELAKTKAYEVIDNLARAKYLEEENKSDG